MSRLSELELRLDASVVTIGVFDGMHLGHQSILEHVAAAATRRGLPAVCVTFSVHPRAVLSGDGGPRQILSLEHRLALLAAAGIEHVIVLEFSDALAATEAEAFVDELLVTSLGVRELVIGHDTAVGKGRRGDGAFLVAAGERHGFKVVALGEVLVDGQLVSSTAVRAAIAAGDLHTARRLLDRPASLLGQIVHGDGRGATIGFPTANLEVRSEAFPPHGVYAVCARCPEGDLRAVMNYGVRPTFKQAETRAIFEVHVLDRDDLQLYGASMEVFLLEFLRPEQRFADVDELVAQIRADVETARRVPDQPLPPRLPD